NCAANASARAQSSPETSCSTAPVRRWRSSPSFASRAARLSSFVAMTDLLPAAGHQPGGMTLATMRCAGKISRRRDGQRTETVTVRLHLNPTRLYRTTRREGAGVATGGIPRISAGAVHRSTGALLFDVRADHRSVLARSGSDGSTELAGSEVSILPSDLLGDNADRRVCGP